MNFSPEKLAPGVAYVVIGLIMVLVGATGVVPIGNPQLVISEPGIKVGLIIIGSVLILLGPMLTWKEISLSKSDVRKNSTGIQKQNKRSTRFGIKISAPAHGARFKGGHGNIEVKVSGTYTTKPDLDTRLRLFVKTEEPLAYWRHPAVVDFEDEEHIWHGKVDLWKGPTTKPYSAYIVAVVLDKVGEMAVQQAAKVQLETNENIPFDSLPSYIEKSDNEILVFRD